MRSQGNVFGEDKRHFMKKWLTSISVILMLGLASVNVSAQVVDATYAKALKNRFRIDHMVDEVTLFIQRDYGSSPVIVVLPDGSKWYQSRHPESVKWADGLSGDIITIKDPMPGPWQLLGQVAKGSMVEQVSKLNIDVQPLPQPVYQGERLKVVAKLMGDEQRLRMPGLDYLVNWTVRFVSEHRPGDANFAEGTLIVGSYKDNGEQFDEQPDDGVFTSEINLTYPWGHYSFQVTAENTIFSREFRRDFMLSPIPVTLQIIEPDDHLNGRWQLQLSVDDSQLALENTHFEFELVGPAGLRINLPLPSITVTPFELQLPTITEFGSYRITGSVVSTTQNGREVVLKLPEQFFNLVPPPAPPPTPEELAVIAAKKAAIAEAKAKDAALFWIMTINGTLLVVGLIALVVWRKRQNLHRAMAVAAARLDQQRSQELGPTLDEIDLSMPEDLPRNKTESNRFSLS